MAVVAAVSATVAAAMFPLACSSSSSSTTEPDSGGGGGHSSNENSKSSSSSKGGGKSSSSSKETTSSSKEKGSKDAGSDAVSDAKPATECPDGADIAGLYARLGKHAGIRAAVNAIVAQELMNDDIKTYFFYQTPAGVKLGHPTADQIEECFTDFVGAAVGGPEKYPTTLDADAGGGTEYTCRDLKTAHRSLEINEGTYTEFLGIAANVLTSAGVCPTDIATLAGALTTTGDGGVETEIVTSKKKSDGGEEFPGNASAASLLDASY